MQRVHNLALAKSTAMGRKSLKAVGADRFASKVILNPSKTSSNKRASPVVADSGVEGFSPMPIGRRRPLTISGAASSCFA